MQLRTDLCSSQAAQEELERESQQLMLQVHSLQCQVHSKTAPHESDMIKKKLVSLFRVLFAERNSDQVVVILVENAMEVEKIAFQEQEIAQFRSEIRPPAKLQAEVELLRKENERYRQMMLSMQSEVYGARLAAKYLDKELAGRYTLLRVCL
ncbi:unnamed protein product [Anisakis simplex]|uniref:HOOK domain-containing protein n=1 Tax=Anisakis simplex TaxID=6269 RepID=A0A0M3KJC7_ANISI|nr:unnamed protein product [Anisakis simplex]